MSSALQEPTRRRIGMPTPSSNTILGPLSGAPLAGLPGVSAHFSRFRVTEISATPGSLSPFEAEPMLAAAGLFADAL